MKAGGCCWCSRTRAASRSSGCSAPRWRWAASCALAMRLAAALGQLHARGLIHKDLKPAHLLVELRGRQVRLTGFGIASRLPREQQAPAPPEIIAGTLAYMAPEQTGRMNRSIDSRSDLYALGIIFYEMLTGALPFTAADPMEWVHCHIARQPVPPDARVASIPGPLSAIVHEAARQDRRGPLPDGRRPCGRSAALPGGMAGDRRHRAIPARARRTRRTVC